VAANAKKWQASEQVEQVLGSVAFVLPNSHELADQFLYGDLFKDLSMSNSKGFRKEIEKICSEVFGC